MTAPSVLCFSGAETVNVGDRLLLLSLVGGSWWLSWPGFGKEGRGCMLNSMKMQHFNYYLKKYCLKVTNQFGDPTESAVLWAVTLLEDTLLHFWKSCWMGKTLSGGFLIGGC